MADINTNTINTSRLIAVSGDNNEYEVQVKDDFEYSFQNEEIRLELIEEADGFIILSSKGVRYPVEIVSRKQNNFEILVNGVSYAFSVETPFSLRRKKLLAEQGGVSKTEIIKSPMPGKILDVMVSEGQQVNIGEPLLVLEAMKMQNTLTSSVKGVVSKVNIKTGDTTGKDDVLVEIEKN